MANRPVYMIDGNNNFKVISTEFKFHPGFAVVQKQKSIASLHAAFMEKHSNAHILEISSKSSIPLGVSLSAFNLSVIGKTGIAYNVETLFQSSKVFANGGPYLDILNMSSRDAKRDPRLKTSGELKCFRLGNVEFPLEPKTFFYNWIYLHALAMHPKLTAELINYDAFTDIEFNPQKSINCQAEAAVIYVSLYKKGVLKEALSSKNKFLELVYNQKVQVKNEDNLPVQESLF